MTGPSPRVRFAPSPTGYLHVGGARTAIFNWLFARRHGGTFILRVEDTDLERSSDEVVQAILDGMAWLGLEPDEGPFFQSASRERHVADARRLLAGGHAYRCFCDTETLKRERATIEVSGGTYIYPRRCLRIPPADSERRAASGEPHAIRFRVPERRVEWNDAVHGPTAFDASLIEDFVLLRSDTTPTYMMSVVSDDIDMRITHVIRGDDHLSNTPKQILIYGGLEVAPPVFAHLPLILGQDKKRLSKRHGATSVLDYRERGFLPEALFNFLALLGWSPGDDRQKMSRQATIDAFDLEGIGKSGAVFDLKKLEWLNGLYLAERSFDELEPEIRGRLTAAGLWDENFAGPAREWLQGVVRLLQPRCRTLADFLTEGRYFFEPSEQLEYDPSAAQKHLHLEGLAEQLRELRRVWARLPAWEPRALEEALRRQAEEHGLAAGKLIHPVRLAVTGRGASPGLFEVAERVGRERTLARIDRLIAQLNGHKSG